jgi:hypothetical protein
LEGLIDCNMIMSVLEYTIRLYCLPKAPLPHPWTGLHCSEIAKIQLIGFQVGVLPPYSLSVKLSDFTV